MHSGEGDDEHLLIAVQDQPGEIRLQDYLTERIQRGLGSPGQKLDHTVDVGLIFVSGFL